MLDNLFKSLKKEEHVTERVIKKEGRKVNKAIVPFEQNPMNYTINQRLFIIGISMGILSLYSKYINLGHWMFTDFDLSSYPPEAAFIAIASSILAFMYGYYKEDKILEGLGLIGGGFTVLFVLGIINTYCYKWVWWA